VLDSEQAANFLGVSLARIIRLELTDVA
jgi:hypothetical protein